MEDGVVQPITPYLKELGIDLSQHYSQASIDAVTFDGEVYAVRWTLTQRLCTLIRIY